jgi:hypothetical protein
MTSTLVKEAKKVLAGKAGRLEDDELEYLAHQITKLGFKLGYARAYAAAPSLVTRLVHELERQEEQMSQIRKTLGFK